MVTPRTLCAFLAVLLIALVAVPAVAGEHERDRHRSDEELHKILDGLKHGIYALEALGRREEAEHVERIARELVEELEARERRRRADRERHGEREMVERHLEILRLAMPALREGEKRREAAAIERAIHLLELMLEGARAEKLAHAKERAPTPEQTIEILHLAARLWKEFGHPDKAERLVKAIHEAKREAHRGEAKRERGRTEREMAEHMIEVYRAALKAFAEKEMRDAAHLMELAAHAMKLRLDGRRDEEARRVYERAPKREQQIDLLRRAAEIWAEFGHEKKSHACRKLAEHLAGRDQEGRQRAEDDHDPIVQLARRMDEMARMMEELRRELERLRRER
jgi:hypothetical protein